jgi:F0F1-type ATP synthase epsilon subunit
MTCWPRLNVWLLKALAVAERLHLVVLTPSETVADVEQIQWVHVNLVGTKALTVWPGHAPVLAETATDALQYADAAGTHTLDLPAGILQVQDSTVTLFLAGTLGEQAWLEDEDQRFERLAETMRDPKRALSPGVRA